MNLSFISAMHGWTTVEKATELYELTLKIKPEVAVEIGVFGGRGTIAIALALAKLGKGKIIAVDPWDAEASASSQTEPQSEKWWKDTDHDAIYESCLWHISKQGVQNFVEVRRETSEETECPKEIGLLIIDGAHDEHAVSDAKKFAPNVILGGYCLLDDLDWVGGYVRQAEEFIKSIGFSFVRLIDGQSGLYQRVEMQSSQSMTAPERNIPDEPARLTVAYVTSRHEPMFQWFFDSLANQIDAHDKIKVIIVDLWKDKRNQEAYDLHGLEVKWVEPKPTIWQGKHRITKEDWWAMSNARNTAICLCETEWIAFLDDRCVLLPSWLGAVKKAMAENYIVVGSYEKRSKMVVERGFIKGFEKLIGKDPRLMQAPNGKKHAPHSWFFSCTFAMPLETILSINGFEEGADSLSAEDSIMGCHLRNSGHTITYDVNMRMVEDRTEGECGPNMRRESKEKHPNDINDKGHAALHRFGSKKHTEFTTDLKTIRLVLSGGGAFPLPSQNKHLDWFDSQPVEEF